MSLIDDASLDENANYRLGCEALQAGRAGQSLAYFMAALEADPGRAQYWSAYIGALMQAGEYQAAKEVQEMARQQGLIAVASPREIRADESGYAELAALFSQGCWAETEMRARAMTESHPENGFGWKVLGAVCRQLGHKDEACAYMQRAATLLPDDAEVHCNLGITLHESGRDVEAGEHCRRALQIRPDFAEAHNNLAIVLYAQGRLLEAESSCRQALRINPDYAEAHNNLGIILRELGRLDDAQISYRRALQIQADYADAYCNLGLTLHDLGQSREAEVQLKQALRLRPDYSEALCNLAVVLLESGRVEEAAACFRHALQLNPKDANLHSNLIFTLDLMETEDTASLQRERRLWNDMHASAMATIDLNDCIPDPERRLRIGYVSADFRVHSAPKVFGGMLTDFDRDAFDVYVYSNFKGREDKVAGHFKQSVTCWKNISGITDEALASVIHEDKIDILLDLSGHSAGNRLLAFARKPAPLQITAWGYATSTGLKTMDVFFTDAVDVPRDEAVMYTEQLGYLPCVVGYFADDVRPDVNELPALTAGCITFGSFNRLVKNSQAAYQAWAAVLKAVPGSRMIIKTQALDDAGTRDQVLAAFASEGILPERVVLQGKTSGFDHLAAFNQVDISLDPFPHCGGVTTLEGLSMGVPVVTLGWPTPVGRVSASALTLLGLNDWIAESEAEYVALAVKKAAELHALAALRRNMRHLFDVSIFGRPKDYVRAVEQEYRRLWRAWCASR